MMPSTMKLDVVYTGCCRARIQIILHYFIACLPVEIVIRFIAFLPTVSHSFFMEMKSRYLGSARRESMK
jgi:hypothetical protein